MANLKWRAKEIKVGNVKVNVQCATEITITSFKMKRKGIENEF